jgi:hypothetical protein
MLTLINGTSRTLIADLASDLAPLRHLGILAPADVLPIPSGCLEGGLRLIDAGVQGDAEAQRAALDAADVAEAFGEVRNVMWLSPLTCPYDGKPTAEEEAAWRSTFERPDAEHLVRYYPSCTLGEKSAPSAPHAQLQVNVRGHQGIDEPDAFGAHGIGELVLERDGAAERGAVKVGAALQVTDGDGAAQPAE